MGPAEPVKDLQADLSRLDSRLREEVQPRLFRALQLADELRAKVSKLKDNLGGLSEGRRKAAELFGSLSRSQISEIKQLARNPPESIRRTLIAAWLLLHSDHFRGRSVVQFDEKKDWPKLQRMLGEESFVTSVLAFDPIRLAGVPQVAAFVASTYLGLKLSDDKTLEGDGALEAPAATSPSSVPPPTEGPSRSLPRTASQTSLRRQIRASCSSTHLRRSESRLPKPPLEVDMVSRASEPCGVLLQWMRGLVLETFEHRRLQAQLAPAEAELQAAERRQHAAEGEAAEVEQALHIVRERLQEEQRRQMLEQQARAGGKRESSLKNSATLLALGQRPLMPGREKMQLQSPPALLTPRMAAERRAAQMPQNLPPMQNVPSPMPRDLGVPAMKQLDHTPSAALHLLGKQESGPGPPVCKVELDVTGSMASLRQRLSRLGVPFGWNKAEVLESDPGQAQALAKIKSLLGEHRGRLKLRLQGNCERGERHGIDTDRGLAVARWLQDYADTPAGWLRIEGLSPSVEGGRCVIPLAIQELVPLYGPIGAEAASTSAPVGLYFEAFEAKITQETGVILHEMARWLSTEGASACVEGHSDRAEPADLASQRAEVVYNMFIRLGVNPKHLRLKSRMATCPLSRHAAPNRRAEVHLD